MDVAFDGPQHTIGELHVYSAQLQAQLLSQHPSAVRTMCMAKHSNRLMVMHVTPAWTCVFLALSVQLHPLKLARGGHLPSV